MNFTLLKLKFKFKLFKWKQKLGLEQPFIVNSKNSYLENRPSPKNFEKVDE